LKVKRHSLDAALLLDGRASAWSGIEETLLPLSPSPIALTESVSPYMAKITGHGKVKKIRVRMAHNGSIFSMRLSWDDPDKDNETTDLDEFSDAVSVMFPLAKGATAFTMGSEEKPVNAWFWKAGEPGPFDVLAEGYATSNRRPAETSGLRASDYHEGGTWVVVLQRPMAGDGHGIVHIEPGVDTGIAFAVWEGSNKERSAQKAVSGEFKRLKVDA
jgi:DMSO reductase family type II enzyme heme b subunit|tara:strand:+ start:3958 stop:4605 length:648 start_codon:yes stop_codon:yes gene_type:complete